MDTCTSTGTSAPSLLRVLITAALLTLVCSGCAFAPPSAPTPLPLPQGITPAPEPTNRPTTRAALAIDAFEWRFTGTTQRPSSAYSYFYVPSLRLRETGGTTAVTLETIFFLEPGGSYTLLSNGGCFGGSAGEIDAGGTWSSSSIYPYCLDLDSSANLAGQEVRVTVTFRDALGGFGQVTGTTIVTADAMNGR